MCMPRRGDDTALQGNPEKGESPPWIQGELRTLGIEVLERTVSRLLRQRRRPPPQTWRREIKLREAPRYI